MWLFTTDGFYSAVELEDNPKFVQVRSRTREDSERLASLLSAQVIETPSNDYPFRVIVSKLQWGGYCSAAANTIDYTNFKHRILNTQGEDREKVYGRVWSTLFSLEEWRRAWDAAEPIISDVGHVSSSAFRKKKKKPKGRAFFE